MFSRHLLSTALLCLATALPAQNPGGLNTTLPGGGIGNFDPWLTTAQPPVLFIRQTFRPNDSPKLWVSQGAPQGLNAVAVGITAKQSFEVSDPGGLDAIRLPDGRAIAFLTGMHRRLHAITVPATYAGSGEKIQTVAFTSRPGVEGRGVAVAPDGKSLYVVAGTPGLPNAPVYDEYLYVFPLTPCLPEPIDAANVKEYKLPKSPGKGSYYHIAFEPQGRWLVLSGYSDEVLVASPTLVPTQLIQLPAANGKPHIGVTTSVSRQTATRVYPGNLPLVSAAIYVPSYNSRALGVIACSVMAAWKCEYVTTVAPPFLATPLYGPAGGLFHPSLNAYYWATGATVAGVAVFDTKLLFAPSYSGTHVSTKTSAADSAASALAMTIDPVSNYLYVNGPWRNMPWAADTAAFSIAAATPSPLAPIPYGTKAGDKNFFIPSLVAWARPVNPGCGAVACDLNTLPVGHICTFAGNGNGTTSAASGSLTLSSPLRPGHLATRPGQPLYLMEYAGAGLKIRSIDKGAAATRKIVDVAGSGAGGTVVDGPATNATIIYGAFPTLTRGRLQFLDGNNTTAAIRELDFNLQTITRLAGDYAVGGQTKPGSTTVPAPTGAARIWWGTGLTPLGVTGRLLYRESGTQVGLYDPAGTITHVCKLATTINTFRGSAMVASANGAWIFATDDDGQNIKRFSPTAPSSGVICPNIQSLPGISGQGGQLAYDAPTDTLFVGIGNRVMQVANASSAMPVTTTIANPTGAYVDGPDGPAGSTQIRGINSLAFEAAPSGGAYLYISTYGKVKVLRTR